MRPTVRRPQSAIPMPQCVPLYDGPDVLRPGTSHTRLRSPEKSVRALLIPPIVRALSDEARTNFCRSQTDETLSGLKLPTQFPSRNRVVRNG
jgi:hypothetical protein